MHLAPGCLPGGWISIAGDRLGHFTRRFREPQPSAISPQRPGRRPCTTPAAGRRRRHGAGWGSTTAVARTEVTEHVEIQTNESALQALSDEWSAIAALGSELGWAEWDLPSECPGWTVRDLVSHMIGTERSLLGDEEPQALADLPGYVHNAVGVVNEAWVESRRHVPGPAVLAEFRDVTDRRMTQLRGFDAERFDVVGPSPLGEVPYREFMLVRVMDCWVHEQDIRVATGRPSHRQGAVAELALGRLFSAMPFVVGKQARAPEGALVRFDLTGPPDRVLEVVVRNGRAVMVEPVIMDGPVDAVHAELTMDVEVFWRLACGRVPAAAALAADLVGVGGDETLGRRVLDGMAFMI